MAKAKAPAKRQARAGPKTARPKYGPKAKPAGPRSKTAAKNSSPGRELSLDGRGRLRQRAPSPNAWTAKKEKHFLTVLADTCNVKLAAQEAEVSPQHAYARRKSHAAFRAAWIEAIGIAYSRLELILLDRALNGTEKIVTRRDGSEERMVEYSNAVALTLLKMHRETAMDADEEIPSEDVADLREKISKKLDRLREQEEMREAGTGGSA